MQVDFEVQRFSRKCAITGRQLAPGEVFFSVLQSQGAEIVRTDFAAEQWQGPPETAYGWWQSRVPEEGAKKAKLAPNDVLLQLFDQLADQPERQDMRYVLTLLLIRRRLLRLEEEAEQGVAGAQPKLTVYCPRREESYEIVEAMPSDERVDVIQQELTELLYADAA